VQAQGKENAMKEKGEAEPVGGIEV